MASLEQKQIAMERAAAGGNLEIVKFMLSQGAGRDLRSSPALQWAAENGHLEIAQCLLDAGADVNRGQEYALRLSATNGHTQMVRLLLAHGANAEPVLKKLATYADAVQAALVSICNISGSVPTLARQGVCPAALCARLERLGHTGLATMISASRMLDPLTPDARAATLDALMRTTNLEVSPGSSG